MHKNFYRNFTLQGSIFNHPHSFINIHNRLWLLDEIFRGLKGQASRYCMGTRGCTHPDTRLFSKFWNEKPKFFEF